MLKCDYSLIQYISKGYNEIINLITPYKHLRRLHINGYIHGDVKPHNMLFLDNELYLFDFGHMINFDEKQIKKRHKYGKHGTPGYVPYLKGLERRWMEVIKNLPKYYLILNDIYGFAITVLLFARNDNIVYGCEKCYNNDIICLECTKDLILNVKKLVKGANEFIEKDDLRPYEKFEKKLIHNCILIVLSCIDFDYDYVIFKKNGDVLKMKKNTKTIYKLNPDPFLLWDEIDDIMKS